MAVRIAGANQPELSVDHYRREPVPRIGQARPFTLESGELVLRTPPMRLANGTAMVSEPAWVREAP